MSNKGKTSTSMLPGFYRLLNRFRYVWGYSVSALNLDKGEKRSNSRDSVTSIFYQKKNPYDGLVI